MQLSLYGNNKGTLYKWGEFLTYHHTFGKSHKVVDIRLNPDATTKYELLIDGCTEESIDWMLANFEATKMPPSPVSKFKRIWEAPKYDPIWTVNQNMKPSNFFVGSEQGARDAFTRLQADKKTWLILLICEELDVREEWKKSAL